MGKAAKAIRDLEKILGEASRQDFASLDDEEAWLAEHGVTFEPGSWAVCSPCQLMFSADHEPAVGYGEALRARCIKCGGPTTKGS